MPKTHYGTPHGDTAVPLCGTRRRADNMTPFPETVTCQRCQRALERPAVFVPTWPPDWLPPTAWPSSVYAKHHGGCCPVCQSGDIAGKSFDTEAHVVWQDVRCQRCGAAWQDVYYLQGYDRLDLSEYRAPGSVPEEPEVCVTGMCVNDATCPRQLHCRRHACDCPEEGERDA